MSFARAFNFQLSRKLLWNEVNRICSANSIFRKRACVIIGRQSPAKYYSVASSQNRAQFHLSKRKNINLHLHHDSAQGKVSRNFSSQGSEAADPSEGEASLKNTIKKCFPKATNVVVQDISGGCGSMYQIYIESPEFTGLSTVKQHRLVNEALKQEIKSMHGIRIQTAVSK